MTIETEPLLVRGQHVMRVSYVKAEGANGTQSSAVVLFNANTGEFQVKNTTPNDSPNFDFDLPVDEFKKKRAKGKRGSTTPNPSTAVTPTQSVTPNQQ